MKEKYKEVRAQTNLPESNFLYEAQCDLECDFCGATIPANSYFGRKIKPGNSRPTPHCRQCLPLKIYTDLGKRTVAHRTEEYLHVKDIQQ